MESMVSRLPQAREAGLLRRELAGGELMVYDTERHQAHSLNRTAALIWQQCDGQTTVDELSIQLSQELHLSADEAMVWLALDRLAKAHLLRERLAVPPAGISRRAVIRKWGLAGGLAALLPVVDSIHAPVSAQAASVTCLRGNQPCSPGGVPCCFPLVCASIEFDSTTRFVCTD